MIFASNSQKYVIMHRSVILLWFPKTPFSESVIILLSITICNGVWDIWGMTCMQYIIFSFCGSLCYWRADKLLLKIHSVMNTWFKEFHFLSFIYISLSLSLVWNSRVAFMGWTPVRMALLLPVKTVVYESGMWTFNQSAPLISGRLTKGTQVLCSTVH